MQDKDTPMMRAERRIMIFDQHPLVRRGLTALVDGIPKLSVCAESEDELSGLSEIPISKPDLVIVDPLSASGDGLEFVKSIRAQHPRLPILILTTYETPQYIERAFTAGANGYVVKQESGDIMLTAISCVLAGEKFLSPRIKAKLKSR